MAAEPKMIGRYALHEEIASGGMATVHLGRLLGQAGFSRTVAIKRLHPPFAKDPDFVAMFLEEAHLAARIQHPNVVSTLDVETSGDELLLVLEFVLGESLAKLIRASHQTSAPLPLPVIGGIIVGALEGLHAAHEAKSESGEPLGLVHRDISPQNILVGVDGVARVLDFGIAKATRRSGQTRSGMLKGKVAYMAPEQIKGGAIDRRIDLYSMGVVLWETLTCYRLFDGDDDFQIANKILSETIPPPSQYRSDIPPALDKVVLQALAREPSSRFPSALAMIAALESAVTLASSREISRWVERLAGTSIRARRDRITAVERSSEPVDTSDRPSLIGQRPSFLRAPGDPPRSSTLVNKSAGLVPPPPIPPPPLPRSSSPSLSAAPSEPIEVPPSPEEKREDGVMNDTESPLQEFPSSEGSLDEPPPAEETIAQAPLSSLLEAPALLEDPEPRGSSRISSISVFHTNSLTPSARPALRWGVGAIAVLLLGGGLLWARSSNPPSQSPLEKESTAPVVSTIVSAEAIASAEPEVSPTTSSSALPAASSPPEGSSSPPVKELPIKASPSAFKPARPLKLQKKNHCNPPYTIDSRGIKRIKPECT